MFKRIAIAGAILGLLMPLSASAAYGSYGYGTPYVYTVPFATHSTSPYYNYCGGWYTQCGYWNWDYGHSYGYGYNYGWMDDYWYDPPYSYYGMSTNVHTGSPWHSPWGWY